MRGDSIDENQIETFSGALEQKIDSSYSNLHGIVIHSLEESNVILSMISRLKLKAPCHSPSMPLVFASGYRSMAHRKAFLSQKGGRIYPGHFF
jgi:hypothetical protein